MRVFENLLGLCKDNPDNKFIVRALKFIAGIVIGIIYMGFGLLGIVGIVASPFVVSNRLMQEAFPKTLAEGEWLSLVLFAICFLAPCCVAYVMITGIRDDAVIKTEKRYESAERSYKSYVSYEAKQIRAILDQYKIPSPDSEEIYKLLKDLEGKDEETNS